MHRTLSAILAADVVGYSRLMEVDEARTLDRLTAVLREVVRPAVQERRGRIFKVMGDGVLAQFQSVVDAVEAALAIQRAMAARETDLADDRRIWLRIGVNVGDVMIEGSDVYGDGVNVAARIEQIAPAGGICLSGSAHEQVLGKVQAVFDNLGEQTVKNISRPFRVWCWQDGARREPLVATPGSVPDEQSSLAVLPFMNMSDDRSLRYLADGLTEDVITLLARIPGFLVISSASSFALKDRIADPREIGRELGVSYLVEGSLRPFGRKVRLTVQLIDPATGNQLWAKRFDQPAGEVENLQDDIAIGIASWLVPELTRVEVEKIRRRDAVDLGAWGLYKQASGLLSLKGWHRETFVEAIDLLNRAVEIDPEFALAHAYLSLMYAVGHMFGLTPDDTDAEHEAITKAEQAMQIDGHNAHVMGYAGCALADVGRLGQGIAILERAIETDPSNAQAWVALGTALMRCGKVRRGVEMLRHGMRISPLDNRLAYWGTNLAYALFRMRQLDEAEAEARRACARDERNYMARIVLALVLLQRKREAEARQAVGDALRLRPGLEANDLRSLIGRRGVEMLRKESLLP